MIFGVRVDPDRFAAAFVPVRVGAGKV